MKNRKRKVSLVLLILIVCITLGYAALRTGLNINGIANVTSSSWEVYFANYQKSSSTNITPTTEPSIPAGEKPTTISYVVDLDEPGDVYEFTVDVVNNGTIDAMIESITSKLNDVEIDSEHPVPSYLNYSITYADDVVIQPNHALEHNTHETYKVRIEYSEDVDPEDLPSTAQQLRFDLTVVYGRDDGSGVPVRAPAPVAFTTDSWETIVNAVKAGNISAYNVGDTKCVALDGFTTTNNNGCDNGEFALRIANTSTPAECSTEGFSQTACGFVLEFADVITQHRMNPWVDMVPVVDGDANKGGWPATEMRTYVNTDIYNALPSDLKSKIIDTTVVSGHGYSDPNNFTSTDKLYLLSTKEVWGKEGTSNVITKDSAETETRQLDYYSAQNVTTDSYSGAIKQSNGSNISWWLRSAHSGSDVFFIVNQTYGRWSTCEPQNKPGVSPAFRIGKTN